MRFIVMRCITEFAALHAACQPNHVALKHLWTEPVKQGRHDVIGVNPILDSGAAGQQITPCVCLANGIGKMRKIGP